MQNASSTENAPVPLVQRHTQRMADHIQKAADKTGVSFDYLLAQANQESKLDPDARNSRSSASGLFQFTAGTWLSMISKHGAEYGLEKYAKAIGKSSSGQYYVKDKDLKAEILELRRDPALSSQMAAEYAKDNAKFLQKKLGRDISNGDLYMAHFLGPAGALKVLKGLNEQGSGTGPELAQAAQSNPDVFQDQSTGQQRSMEEVYRSVGRRFKRAMADAASIAQRLRPEVDLAALRPEARPESDSHLAMASAASAPATDPFTVDPSDLARFGFFPVALPPRPAQGALSPPNPSTLPSTRADAGTMQELLTISASSADDRG